MGSVTYKRADFRGWNAVYLSNELVSLVAVPDIGGRIMEYNLGEYEYLFVDPDLAGKLFTPEENYGSGRLVDWKNYGGEKTWPAPQGWESESEWHGPPDPVLDTGIYTIEDLGGDDTFVGLKMVSPSDPRTGIQISRKVKLKPGSSRVYLDLAFTNVSQRPIRWSIWDVVQLNASRKDLHGAFNFDPGCFITAPLNPASCFPKGYNVMFGEEDNPQWQTDTASMLFKAAYKWEIGKVGIDSPGGWIAFSNTSKGYGFVEMFEYEAGGEYPDSGASVECWTVGAGVVDTLNYEDTQIYLMETEVLSTIRAIDPGESSLFKLEWGACCCPELIVEVSEAGCFSTPLNTSREAGGVRLQADFGVFDVGMLQLSWVDECGEIIMRQELGRVSPLEAVQFDKLFKRPPGSVEIVLGIIPDISKKFQLLSRKHLD